MSDLDLYLGSVLLGEVNALRVANGRWALQTDDRLSVEAWEHVQWMERCGLRHADGAWLEGRTENVAQGVCIRPEGLISHLVWNSDPAHRWNFLREDICAQGVAILTHSIDVRNRLSLMFSWRARKT